MFKKFIHAILKLLNVCTHENERITTDGMVECMDCTRKRPLAEPLRYGSITAAVMENTQRMERANRHAKEATPQEIAALRKAHAFHDKQAEKIATLRKKQVRYSRGPKSSKEALT